MSELQVAMRLLIVPAVMLVAVLLLCVAAYFDHRLQVHRCLTLARRWNGCVYDGGFGNELLYVEIPLSGVRAQLRILRGKLPGIELKFPISDPTLDVEIRPANFGERLASHLRVDSSNVDCGFMLWCGCKSSDCSLTQDTTLQQILADTSWKCRTRHLGVHVASGEARLVLQEVSLTDINVDDAIEALGQVFLVLRTCQEQHGKSQLQEKACLAAKIH